MATPGPQHAHEPPSEPDSPTPEPTTGARNKNLDLWVPFTIMVVLCVGLAGWLVLGGRSDVETSAQTSPVPSVSERQPSAAESSNSPTEVPDFRPGDPIAPLSYDDCTGKARDEIAEEDDGWYYSGVGMAMPAIEGYGAVLFFMAAEIYQANSQVTYYEGTDWISSMTIGTLRSREGYITPKQSAYRLGQCMIRRAYVPPDNEGVKIVSAEEIGDSYRLTLEMPITDTAGVTGEIIIIETRAGEDVIHVAFGTVESTDETNKAAMLEAFDSLRYP